MFSPLEQHHIVLHTPHTLPCWIVWPEAHGKQFVTPLAVMTHRLGNSALKFWEEQHSHTVIISVDIAFIEKYARTMTEFADHYSGMKYTLRKCITCNASWIIYASNAL